MSFGGLYTAISGLQASRYSLDTVSHNISNANNPNYVRQSAIHSNNPYRRIGTGQMEMGTGVNVIQIRQIRDEFLDIQIRRELPTFGYYYSKSQTLEDVEAVFNEITDSGLQSVMEDFWTSWDELSKDPSMLTNREIVHESSVAFAETVNHISDQLNYIQQDLNKQIINKVGEVNNLLEAIASINKSVKRVEGNDSKMKANDLRDERNAMIDRLSELLPVKTYENSYGESIVSLQGQDLITGNFVRKIDIQTDENGLGHIYWENSSEKIELGKQGELSGLIDVRDTSVKEYRDRLDTLVGEMAKAINDIHRTGFGLGDPAPTGMDFFKGVNVNGEEIITAANIKVNPEMANLNNIAASASGASGDDKIAKEIHEIRNTLRILKYGATVDDESNKISIDSYYNDLVTSLALEREEARSSAEHQAFLINSIDEKRIGLSAVSLDEEMADMIKFQHAYSANSRVINALDEMIETIVNRLGVVGR